uniref:Uncharacterized protein n=1 Tax=Anguilla anguilla TaxID=7936 RepID=A0A0E9RY55_ANGAN
MIRNKLFKVTLSFRFFSFQVTFKWALGVGWKRLKAVFCEKMASPLPLG